MVGFVESFAKMFVQNKESVRVKSSEQDDGFVEIVIYADKIDTGRLIGKDGKMINSIKTLISGSKAKNGSTYRIRVVANDE